MPFGILVKNDKFVNMLLPDRSECLYVLVKSISFGACEKSIVVIHAYVSWVIHLFSYLLQKDAYLMMSIVILRCGIRGSKPEEV
jgi:hypothetical protein